jgi:hypothetical protein
VGGKLSVILPGGVGLKLDVKVIKVLGVGVCGPAVSVYDDVAVALVAGVVDIVGVGWLDGVIAKEGSSCKSNS